mgnify:CR=1 FL=1
MLMQINFVMELWSHLLVKGEFLLFLVTFVPVEFFRETFSKTFLSID